MTSYMFNQGEVAMDVANIGQILANAHKGHERPGCLCRKPNPKMYIARVGDSYIIKRMPNSGAGHATSCESYVPPAELSGYGEVLGSAIQENVDTGTTLLKLDFALNKMGARLAPTPGTGDADSVRTDGKKLTLRGLLHFLWSEAGFNRWTPAMEGKRNWAVIRRYLMEALANKETKGEPVAASTFIPEPFHVDRKVDIAARRAAKLAPLMSGQKGSGKKLMLVIAEVKDIVEARYGFKIIAKHLPDVPLMLAEDIYKRMTKRFAAELALWRNDSNNHLLVIGTFGITPTGYATIEEASLMLTTPEWIPAENGWDAMLVRDLVTNKRQFLKGLRFNLPTGKPLASAVTADTSPTPVAMYLLPEDAEASYLTAVQSLADDSDMAAWYWRPGPDAAVPALPALNGFVSHPFPEVASAGHKGIAEEGGEESEAETEMSEDAD